MTTRRTPERPEAGLGRGRRRGPAEAEAETEAETEEQGAVGGPSYLGEPGPPLDHRAPFYLGFVGAAGALVAYWLLTNIAAIGSTLILIVVALFLAAGLNPAVTFFERRGLRRSYAVVVVIVCVLVAVGAVPRRHRAGDHRPGGSITDQAPSWFDRLQNNQTVQDLDDEYDVIDKARDYVTGGDFVGTLFGVPWASGWRCSARCSTRSSSWC